MLTYEEYQKLEFPKEIWDSNTQKNKIMIRNTLDDPNKTKRQKQLAIKKLEKTKHQINELERMQTANWLIGNINNHDENIEIIIEP